MDSQVVDGTSVGCLSESCMKMKRPVELMSDALFLKHKTSRHRASLYIYVQNDEAALSLWRSDAHNAPKPKNKTRNPRFLES
jgi:hypothetical protein